MVRQNLIRQQTLDGKSRGLTPWATFSSLPQNMNHVNQVDLYASRVILEYKTEGHPRKRLICKVMAPWSWHQIDLNSFSYPLAWILLLNLQLDIILALFSAFLFSLKNKLLMEQIITANNRELGGKKKVTGTTILNKKNPSI